MKKWLVYILCLSFMGLSVYLLAKKKQQQVDIEIIYVDEIEEEKIRTIKFCAIDKYDNYDLIDISIHQMEEDELYLYIFDLYNHKRNSLPIGHEVISKHVLEINSLNLNDDQLTIDVQKSLITTEELDETFYVLSVTYKLLGITKLIIQIDGIEYKSKIF